VIKARGIKGEKKRGRLLVVEKKRKFKLLETCFTSLLHCVDSDDVHIRHHLHYITVPSLFFMRLDMQIVFLSLQVTLVLVLYVL